MKEFTTIKTEKKAYYISLLASYLDKPEIQSYEAWFEELVERVNEYPGSSFEISPQYTISKNPELISLDVNDFNFVIIEEGEDWE